MRRLSAVILILSLAVLACAVPGLPATADPGTLGTAVAATLTALAPTVPPVGEPTDTPAAPEDPTATPVAAATDTPAPAPGAACALAYADGSNLFCLGADGTPALLATAPGGQGIWDPAISPDGQWVAYLVGPQGLATELWAVGADPALVPPRIVVNSATVPSPNPDNVWFPRSFAWRPGTHTLFFDTRWEPVGGIQGPGEYTNNDLWLADVDSVTAAAVLGEQIGGSFAVSPDGSFVAFSYPTGLGLVNADGSNLRRDLVTFPSIITYSEYFFKPAAFWQADSLAFNVAVPSADPLAPDPSATLYRVGTDGIVQTLATVPGNFVFGGLIRPMFSPDGQWAVYSQLLPDSGPTEDVHLMRLAGEATTNTVVDTRAVLSGWGWSPNGDHFAYASTPGDAPGSGYDLGLEGPIRAWAPGLTQIIRLDWQDPTTFYFIGQINNAGWALYRQPLGAEPVLLASGLGQQAGLDVLPAP
jgi:hypothetical protein